MAMIVITAKTGWRAVRSRLRNPPNAVSDPAQDPKRGFYDPITPPDGDERRLRDLEGRLDRIEVLMGSGVAPAAVRPTLAAIIGTVARHYGFSVDDLCSRRCERRISRVRHVAMHLARRLTDHTHEEIGRALDRHYTSVFYGLQRVAADMRREPGFRAEIDHLCRQLTEAAVDNDVAPAPATGE
jgi:hypothetical protein